MMVGSKDDFAKDVRARLQDVELNILEQGLLDKFLQDPSTCAKNVLGLLRKLEEKNLDNKFTLKKLRKVIPLFDEHDFWHTQPVPRYYDSVPDSDYNAPIETKTVSEVPQEPYALPKGYHWSEINLHEKEQAEELYKLLADHYVEDSEGKFRFDYSIDFLKWALTPPGQYPEWLVGVRGGQANQLYGFLSAIPVHMVVNGREILMAEVNFLCVDKRLRAKRLAPILIKEITRRVNLKNIWQAIYTSGVTLPTPFGTAPYWHRNLNPKKTCEVQFSYKPMNVPMANFIKKHKLP